MTKSISLVTRWADSVSATKLLTFVVATGLVAILSLAFSVVSVRTSVETSAEQTRVSARTEALAAEQRAYRAATCDFWAFQAAPDPVPQTARGLDQLRVASEHYAAQDCDAVPSRRALTSTARTGPR